MKESRKIAYSGMLAALSIVIMLLGSILELGMYAAPMFAGLCLIPVGRAMGMKYQLILWIVVSLLSFMLVPGVEQNLMFLALFGPYPILYPLFHRLKGPLRLVCKLAFFNVVTVAVEALVMLVLVPEALGTALTLVLLLLGNITFICYDFLVPRWELLLGRFLKRFK